MERLSQVFPCLRGAPGPASLQGGQARPPGPCCRCGKDLVVVSIGADLPPWVLGLLQAVGPTLRLSNGIVSPHLPPESPEVHPVMIMRCSCLVFGFNVTIPDAGTAAVGTAGHLRAPGCGPCRPSPWIPTPGVGSWLQGRACSRLFHGCCSLGFWVLSQVISQDALGKP